MFSHVCFFFILDSLFPLVMLTKWNRDFCICYCRSKIRERETEHTKKKKKRLECSHHHLFSQLEQFVIDDMALVHFFCRCLVRLHSQLIYFFIYKFFTISFADPYPATG